MRKVCQRCVEIGFILSCCPMKQSLRLVAPNTEGTAFYCFLILYTKVRDPAYRLFNTMY